MNNLITSGFSSGQTLTVDRMMADPTEIPTRIINLIAEAQLADYLFRKGPDNQGSVMWQDPASMFLEDDAEEIAEFGEIPVSSPELGGVHTAVATTIGTAIRISYQMRKNNRIDLVQLSTNAASNTMIRNNVRAAMDAFRAANVPTQQVSTKWDATNSNPMNDLTDAIMKIQDAKPDDAPDEGMQFNYNPDVIVASRSTLTLLRNHEKVQKFFVGDIAHENPAYTGATEFAIGGLNFVASRWMPNGEAYVLERGTAGFYSDADPLTATPLYQEGGESGAGGPRRTWRSDFWRQTVYAVDNPKAVVHLKGIV